MSALGRVLALLTTALLVLTAACSGNDDGTSSSSQGGAAQAGGTLTPEKLLIGAAVSLTGATSQEGNQVKNGYELWVNAVNSAGGLQVAGQRYMVELKIVDDTSSPELSAQLAEKLIKDDKVAFLLGPYGTTPTLKVAAVAEQYGVPMVEGGGASETIFNQGYRYTFGVLSPASNYLRSVLDFAVAQRPKPRSVAILSADDAFSVEVAEATNKYAVQLGLQVVYFEKYMDRELNHQAQFAAVARLAPDIFVNAGHLQEAIAMMKQAKDAGLKPMAFAFSVGPAVPDFISTLGNDANYVLTGSQWSTAVRYQGDDYWRTSGAYSDAYSTKYGAAPAYHAASGTAAGIALEKAIIAAGSTDRVKVRDALARLDVNSFYGPLVFDARGVDVARPMVVEQIQQGRRVTIWPAEVANATGLWPTPEWGQR